MIWLGIASYAGLAAALSQGANRYALLVLLAFEVGVQGLKLTALSEARTALFFAAWAIAATWLLTMAIDAGSRLIVTISTLTLLSALCYPLGAVLGQPHYLDGPRVLSHLFWADIFMITAITIGGYHGAVELARGLAVRGAAYWGN